MSGICWHIDGNDAVEICMLLTDKTAVISGAASGRGIGRATAKLFAEHGVVSTVDGPYRTGHLASKLVGRVIGFMPVP